MLTWRRALVYVGLAGWLCGIVGAFYFLWRYKLTPGPLAAAPATWPAETALHHHTGVADVVMIAHPQCPCTPASMRELDRLAEELGDRATIHVVLVRPEGAAAGFEEGRVADLATRIPNAEVIVDDGDREGRRFGAVVSGSTVVYDPAGRLVFRGGLTTARGHEGRGPATDRIVALVAGAGAGRAEAPTFGCELEASAP